MATQKAEQVDILAVMEQAGQQYSANKNAQIQVAQVLQEQQAAQAEGIIQARAAGASKFAIENAQSAINFATDAEVAQTRLNLGSNLADQSSEASFYASEAQRTARAAYAALDRVNAKKSIDFLSDPLAYIEAQFTIGADANEYNALVDKHEFAQGQVKDILSTSNSAVAGALQAKKSTSTELAIASAENARAASEVQVQEMIARNAGTRIQGIATLNEMSAKNLSLTFEVHRMQNAEKQLKMQEASFAEQARMRRLQEADSRERMAAKQQNLDDIKYEMDAYNAGARRVGKPTIDSPQLFISTYKANEKSQEFMNTLSQGKMLMLNKGVTNGVMVADNAGEAALVYAGGQANTPVAKFLKETFFNIKDMPNAPKDRAALASAIKTTVETSAKRQLRAIDDTGTEGNIYAAPPPSVVLAGKGISSPFIDTKLKPILEASPDAPLKAENIVGLALEYAKANGKGGFNDAAASIALYYKKAVLENNAMHQYVENGLPAQSGYFARINGKVVDLSDEVQVKRYMLSETISPMGFGIGGFR